MSAIIDGALRAISAATSDKAAQQAFASVALAFKAERARAKDRSAWDRVTPQSVIAAIQWCARHNLHPGASPPVMYLVPQSGELQARITHVGYAVLAARAGVRLRSIPVAVGDHIEVEFGLAVAHRPADLEKEPQRMEDLMGVIVCVDYRDRCGEVRLWVPRSVIETARNASRSRGGPWQTHPVPMARAAAIRAAARRGDYTVEGMVIPEEPEVIEATAAPSRPASALAAAEARMLEGPAELWDAPEALEAAAREPAQEAR
jgi:recombinational DNA repair protein RecT